MLPPIYLQKLLNCIKQPESPNILQTFRVLANINAAEADIHGKWTDLPVIPTTQSTRATFTLSYTHLYTDVLPRVTFTCDQRNLESNPQLLDCKTTTLPTEPQSATCELHIAYSDTVITINL
ncbi:hypothetical protein ILYODFUR_033334 [Ilyodon furcidens]|uniref:Uncharacterized protein n=1 Tax=Ilyodon furcidens TaxID=33524 RepID=A0ABV0V155_9TELE